MSEETGELAWYCLRTQTKREHIAAAALRELEGVEVLCPRLRYRKTTRRGKIWWVEALFPGYLLAKFDLEERERAVSYANGVTQILRFGGRTPSIPEEFVEELRKELAESGEEGDVLSVQVSVEPGDEVELADGPLQGMTGQVIDVCPAKDRVRIFIEFLGQEHPVDVDLFSLLLPKRPVGGKSQMFEEE
jgi:transcriptional antiterminator RfaH